MGIKKPFNQPLQDNVKHQAKPESNRSKKRRQKELFKIGDPEAIVQSVEMFRQRANKRDGRKRKLDLTIENHIEEVRTALGRKKDTNLSYYVPPCPKWDQLVVEATRLAKLHIEKIRKIQSFDRQGRLIKSDLSGTDWVLFLNSAYHNLVSYGNFIPQCSPSKPKQEILDIQNFTDPNPPKQSSGLEVVAIIKK